VDFDGAKRLIEEFFNGKFEVKKFLGEGSFAKVYLVNNNYLDTLMAMKIIKEP
jgi:serine/threonine protein kinase